MFLMYADESGDPGMTGSPRRFYVLSAVVVHELCWRPALDQLLAFRRRVRDAYGLKLRDELHAARMINKPGELVRIRRHDRLKIIRDFADEIAAVPHLNVINVVVDKEGKDPSYDVFWNAWTVLIQRLEDTIACRNFRGPRGVGDRAMIFPDDTDNGRLRELLRRLRFENPLPGRYGALRDGVAKPADDLRDRGSCAARLGALVPRPGGGPDRVPSLLGSRAERVHAQEGRAQLLRPACAGPVHGGVASRSAGNRAAVRAAKERESGRKKSGDGSLRPRVEPTTRSGRGSDPRSNHTAQPTRSSLFQREASAPERERTLHVGPRAQRCAIRQRRWNSSWATLHSDLTRTCQRTSSGRCAARSRHRRSCV